MAELVSNSWWALALLGLVAGVLSATLGVGSGIVLVPALVMILAVPQQTARGTALAVMVPMAALGALLAWRNPAIEINWIVVVILIGGALVGVPIGAQVANRIPAHRLRQMFAVFMVIAAMRMFFVTPKRPAPPASPADSSQTTTDPVQRDTRE